MRGRKNIRVFIPINENVKKCGHYFLSRSARQYLDKHAVGGNKILYVRKGMESESLFISSGFFLPTWLRL